MTIKGPELSAEWRALLNRGARTAGLTQSAFIVQATTREAQRVLSGENEPAAGPPLAVVADVADRLDERIAALEVETRARIAAIEAAVVDVGQRRWWRALTIRFAEMTGQRPRSGPR